MAGWHSLSGYLHYKSGNNALGRLITRRKVWCILEESQCRLLMYRCEADAHKHGQTPTCIDLQGAAISLDLEHHNQFIILSEKKEHVFTAENHESMMIWLLGLQAKRDLHSKKTLNPNNNNNNIHNSNGQPTQSSGDQEVWGSQPSLFMTCDQDGQPPNPWMSRSMPGVSGRHGGFHWGSYERHADSLDSGIHAYKKSLESSRSFPLSRSHKPGLGPTKHISYSHSVLSCDSDCDDVFGTDYNLKPRPSLSQHWRKLQLAVLGHRLESSSSGGSPPGKPSVPGTQSPTRASPELPSMEPNDRRSQSSRSASSDSAIEKGEGTPQELTLRLAELERELISTKCELAKVMNRQTCYQELLQQRESTIKHLASQSGEINTQEERKSRSLTKRVRPDPAFEERVRVLQNQNRFLNEEVKKLAKLRLQEHGRFQEQNIRVVELEADIERWKMDYVSLIQSSIRYPGDDCFTDDLELCLYGGDKHKKRVQALLEEARKINPRLPTYESLTNSEVHVDAYGFKHVYRSTGLVLHYLCTELTQHYLTQAGIYEAHQKRWTTFMRQHGKDPMTCPSELKALCRGGIPDRFRKQMWRHLVRYKARDIMRDKGDYYYRNLCNLLPDSPLAACYRKQVSLDLMRTMPNNVKFSTQGSKGIMDLQDVLLAFCIHNPTIGYCQGMNFIVGMSLIFMEPEDAFWTLVAIAEAYFSPHYFDHSLLGAQADQLILRDLVQEKLPTLSRHLADIDIELSTVTLNWFLAVFFDAVPFQTLVRIWDCFLLEGPKVLFRFSLAILKLHEREITQKQDTMGVMKHLKACTKLTFDVDGLVKLAFESGRPFPKRRDIHSKHTCYMNTLKEKYKLKELQRLAFAEREQMYMSMEAESGSFLGIECAVTMDNGSAWFCYGDQNVGRLSSVSCDQGTMCTADFKLDSRLMCMCTRSGTDELILGTISWMLVAFDTRTHERTWQIQLHDAILAVCCYDDDDVSLTRVFTGLADGTVAVTEKAYCHKEPSVDVLYVNIGQAPVTSLMLLEEQLWCASGNTVAIIHAKTLDAMDTFSVSVNPYDHILSLVPSNYGIWISLRGSSILELWDPRTLNCRMLYDTRTDRYPQLRKEDDTYFNRSRITSVLAYGSGVWVGTGEGNLVVYEVLESAQLRTPTELSPSVETTSTMSYLARPHKNTGRPLSAESSRQAQLIVTKNDMGLSHQSSLEVNPDSADEYRTFSGDESNSSEIRCISDQSRVSKARNFIRRRSSSENNLEVFQLTRYLTDNVSFPEDRETRSGHQSTEDQVEVALEAHARRQSLTLMLDNGRQRRGSEHARRNSDQARQHMELARRNSENARRLRISGIALNGERGFRGASENSSTESSSRRGQQSFGSSGSGKESSGSAKRRIFAATDARSVEEDEIEMALEQQARRESLKNVTIEPAELLGKKISIKKSLIDSGSESGLSEEETVGSVNMINKQTSLHSEGTVSIFLKDCSLELGEESGGITFPVMHQLDVYDEDYLSSSPCMSLTPVYSPGPDSKRTTVLGMSIDSTEDSEEVDMVAAELPQPSTSIDDLPSPDGKRRSSVIEDISQLCSDCKKAKVRCTECAKLLQSQVSLIMHDRRMSLTTQSPLEEKDVNIGIVNGLREGEANTKRAESSNTMNVHSNVDHVTVNSIDIEISRDKVNRSTVSTENVENGTVVSSDNFEDRFPPRKFSQSENKGRCRKISREEASSFVTRRISLDESNQTAKLTRQNINKEIIRKISSEEMNRDFLRKISHEEMKGRIMRKVSRDSLVIPEGILEDVEQVKVFQGEQGEASSELTRQEKVGFWLSSLSNTVSMDDLNTTTSASSQDSTHNLTDSNADAESTNQTENSRAYALRAGNRNKDGNVNEDRLNHNGSDSEDVFYAEADQRNSECSADRPNTLNLSRGTGAQYRSRRRNETIRALTRHAGSSGSDGSSTWRSSDVHVNKHEQGAQYRLEFSGVHVDTDVDSDFHTPTVSVSHAPHNGSTCGSDVCSSNKEAGGARQQQKRSKYADRDSRKNSLDLGSIQEKCSRLESGFSDGSVGRHSLGSYSASGTSSERQKMFDLLKTPSLASRHASLGLNIIDRDLEWTDLYSGQATEMSPSSSADQRFADFLRTPSMSSKVSSAWSSYENISTPSQAPDNSKLLRPQSHAKALSHSPSSASIGSDNELLYNVDLSLEAKMKISDKPVKCLLANRCNGEPLILSFSGSFGDDEAVLKWTKHQNEQLWTNEPILEYCPVTRTAILPTYMRRRMSSNSSLHSHGSGAADHGTHFHRAATMH